MKPRHIFLVVALLVCIMSIAVIMIKGKPADMVSLDSVAEIGERALYDIHRIGGILTSVSDKEEMEIGDKIHEKIFGSHTVQGVQDNSLDKYLNDVGSKVAENIKRKEIKYKFHIIDGFYPDACALPGGHVYITVGLLMVLRSESELAGVLAHEITHVDAKHCIGAIQYKVRAQKALGVTSGDLVDVGYNLFLRPGYSEAQETEADAGSAYLLYNAGYHPMGEVYAFERIDKNAVSKEHKNSSITPVGDTIKAFGGIIGRYFASHPAVADRIDKIKRYIAENKLMDGNTSFYIGQKNYEEKISRKEKRYKEEFKKDYIITEEIKKEDKKEVKKEDRKPSVAAAPEKNEKLLNEVYASCGQITSGMSVSEVEKKLPKASLVFKRDTRMGYKDITVYDVGNTGKSQDVGLWIELENDKVKGLRIIK